MKHLIRALAIVAGAVATAGCGGKTTMNTAPLTDEQKAQIKAADKSVDDEERSGSGTAQPAKKKR
jgi:hypothetical protein